ncbi:MAG: amidohydrolase family protein [Bacteroidota bacterium]
MKNMNNLNGMKKYMYLGFGILLLSASAPAQVPAPKQTKSILLSNGTAHIGNGTVIENSYIGFKDGKLVLVADATSSKIDPAQYEIIVDAKGKHVYPGLIAPSATIGLIEIGAVRATNDMQETGKYNPNIRALIAYNTDSKIIPTVRTNGVLLAQVCPRGGRISGTSSIMMMDGWNWEDAVLRTDDGIHLNWPNMMSRTGWWAEPGPTTRNKNYDNEMEEMKKFFLDAKAYNEVEKPEETNVRFKAMKGLFSGTQTLYVHANYVKELSEAVFFAQKMGVKKMVIVGGKDSWMITDLLKENNIAVIVNRVHELPDLPEQDIDLPYKLPYLLHKAGVSFCLNNEGDMEQIHTRNLPFMAGTAAAYGLSKEEALMSITLSAAKILGIDKVCGSLEEGKDATLFISTGDALDITTNNVTHAYIQGRAIDLNNEQKELYEMYMKKYGK